MGAGSSKSMNLVDNSPRCIPRAETEINRARMIRRVAELQGPDTFDEEEWEDLSKESNLERPSSLVKADAAAQEVEPSKYKFPFENVVFQGGSAKGMTYVGALQGLEQLGVVDQIKRFAGTGEGAIFAAFMAIGYTGAEMKGLITASLSHTFVDYSWGYLSLLPNLVRSFGWNPGQKAYDWFGEKIKEKTGNADYTFLDLYEDKGLELCIVVTNLNQGQREYCHPKTKPDMPIRNAMRMSISNPCLYSAVFQRHNNVTDTFVDGSVVGNFPVDCFDSWYLSMTKEDSFLRRECHLDQLAQRDHLEVPLEDNKTLGFITLDCSQPHLSRQLGQGVECKIPVKPDQDTALYSAHEKREEEKAKMEIEYVKKLKSFQVFSQILEKRNLKDRVQIDKGELTAILGDTETFPRRYFNALLGPEGKFPDVLNLLDSNGDGLLLCQELQQFMETKALCVQSRYHSAGRRPINGFMDFLWSLCSSTFNSPKYAFLKESDVKRTVGIHTGYIGTSDVTLEQEDREFLVKRGYAATMSFFRRFVTQHPELVSRRQTVSSPCKVKFEDEDGGGDSQHSTEDADTTSGPGAQEGEQSKLLTETSVQP